MKIVMSMLCGLLLVGSINAQVINFTPNANTIVVSTNTTISIGGANLRTFLVCPGVTLSFAESSEMDTILLESGATLKFDSTFSYGYSFIYAKSGSTIDMNFRQTGKLIFVNGVTVIDSNVGPPSFFMGVNLVNSLNFMYTNLPGGVGCAPTALFDSQNRTSDDVTVYNNNGLLTIKSSSDNEGTHIKVVNTLGQVLINETLGARENTLDISALCRGNYYLIWNNKKQHGSIAFSN